MNSALYNTVINMLAIANSNVEDFIKFHQKMQKTEEIKAEKKEEGKIESKAFSQWKPLEKGQSWADYEDEEDEKDFPPLSASSKPAEKATVGNYLSVVSSSVVKVETTRKATEEELKGFFTKTPSRKQGLPVVYSVEEFIEEIEQGRAPNKDFVIDESAHCEHTFRGTLCENVRACGKIHIQRCQRGTSCAVKKCSYLHEDDLEDDEAVKNFRSRNTWRLKQESKIAV